MIQSSNLFKQLQTLGHLHGVSSLLSWDQETYMPEGAVGARASQHEALASLIHTQQTSSAFKDALKAFVDLETGEINPDLNDEERACIREVYSDYKKSSALPSEFVGEFARATSEATHIWQIARNRDDFTQFAPHLDRLIMLSRKKAAYIDSTKPVYDVLLDEYEPGMTVAVLTPLFASLRSGLKPLLSKIINKQSPHNPLSGKSFDLEAQWAYGVSILKEMSYDFSKGRQDKSTHPFTIHFHPDDVRITTRFTQTDFSEGFSSSIHEGGHALYEQGVRPEWFGTPLGEACSLGVHESQSRLWENLVCKSDVFWQGHYEGLQATFSEPLNGLSQQEFVRALNRVEPGLIRVEADEVTYNFHVMIRYEIEQALFNEGAEVMDLPQLWNDKYKDYLGLTPPNHKQGVLQDVHWSCGNFGYFPTYTLGNLFSVMIFEAAKKAIPGLATQIRVGELHHLKEWLNKTIHHPGRCYSSLDLIETVAGQKLSVDPFLNYLESKYIK